MADKNENGLSAARRRQRAALWKSRPKSNICIWTWRGSRTQGQIRKSHDRVRVIVAIRCLRLLPPRNSRKLGDQPEAFARAVDFERSRPDPSNSWEIRLYGHLKPLGARIDLRGSTEAK